MGDGVFVTHETIIDNRSVPVITSRITNEKFGTI